MTTPRQSYIESQVGRLGEYNNPGDLKIQMCDYYGSRTNWINITPTQLEKIKEILKDES